MKSVLPTIIYLGFILFPLIAQSQTNFSYQDYFPKQEIDSVEWYYGAITKEAAEKIDTTQITPSNLKVYFRNDDFPFQDATPLLKKYFEKRATITETSDIQELIKVFPSNSCEKYAVSRCGAIYRDILVFYKNGVAVSVLKICFSCKKVCFVSRNGEQDKNAKCLSNPLSIKEIAREFVRRGWIDLRKAR
ncbi:hypothetical protein [Bernardetia sp.]|uniref:hypothetical protein n=1 Tax=Bernardetia sp. TaxID=1937974 RepID=UPI0025C49080|nr:hypothetical protein [Bernardetia sp.]